MVACVTVENFKPIILDAKSGRGCQREAVAYKVKIIVISQAKFGHHIPLPETVDMSQGAVTVIWVSPCFGYPRTQIPSDIGIPFQNGCRVLGIPRYPPHVPKSLVIWVPLKHANRI